MRSISCRDGGDWSLLLFYGALVVAVHCDLYREFIPSFGLGGKGLVPEHFPVLLGAETALLVNDLSDKDSTLKPALIEIGLRDRCCFNCG